LHEHAQGAQVGVVTERCICNISDVNSQCSCIHSPNKDLGVEKGGFLELRVLFLTISSLLSILSITPLSENLYKKIGKEFSYQYVVIYPYLVTEL
jgi:hypothetical protein